MEAVSGLSWQGLIIDVAAKVLADNQSSLICLAAQAKRHEAAMPASAQRRCNRAYAAHAMLQMLQPVRLFVGGVIATIGNAIDLLARTTNLVISGRSSPRPDHHVKLHERFATRVDIAQVRAICSRPGV